MPIIASMNFNGLYYYPVNMQDKVTGKHFWDQSHVTIVWNTRVTGDIHYPLNFHILLIKFGFKLVKIFTDMPSFAFSYSTSSRS